MVLQYLPMIYSPGLGLLFLIYSNPIASLQSSHRKKGFHTEYIVNMQYYGCVHLRPVMVRKSGDGQKT